MHKSGLRHRQHSVILMSFCFTLTSRYQSVDIKKFTTIKILSILALFNERSRKAKELKDKWEKFLIESSFVEQL